MVEILSVHIPKTAGTAFWRVLTQVYNADDIYHDMGAKSCEPTDSFLQKITVIHTHYSLKKYQGYFPNAKKIVWLRHPIFRLISDYFFSKKYNDRNNPIHVDLVDNNLNILEYAQRNWTRNVMNKFIHAMKIEDFYFVGIQEFYAEDLRDLQQVMGWSDFEIPVSNKNPDSNYYRQLSEILTNRQLINQLASLNQQDIQLYETAMKIRAERRKEVNLMQYTLAEWSRLQFMLEHMQTQKELQAL